VLRYAAAAMAGALLMGVMGSLNNVESPAPTDAPRAGLDDSRVLEGIIPAGDAADGPSKAPAGCLLATGVIDRQTYPTAAAVVRRCSECHADRQEAFPATAQPISIEAPPELEAAADLIVRELRGRRHARMLAGDVGGARGSAALLS
jgi:hypothetical protein